MTAEVTTTVTLAGGLTVDERALQLVLDLERRDVQLWCDDRGLHVDPRQRLTASDVEMIRVHRLDVVALVTYTPPERPSRV
jgi:hypothetical protein